jgi:hypothetical protein
VTYEGEFELELDEPSYESEAQETNNGPTRKIVVFRMRRKATQPKPGQSPLDAVLGEGTKSAGAETGLRACRTTQHSFVAHAPRDAVGVHALEQELRGPA